jgi:hypothetical protein
MPHQSLRGHDRWTEQPHGTDAANPAEIVSLDINNHAQLGAFLRVDVKLARQLRVTARVGATRTRPLDGLSQYNTGRLTQKQLGRRTEHLEVAKAQGRGVVRSGSRAQPRQQVNRLPADIELQPMCQINLIDLTFADEVQGGRHALCVKVIRFAGPELQGYRLLDPIRTGQQLSR